MFYFVDNFSGAVSKTQNNVFLKLWITSFTLKIWVPNREVPNPVGAGEGEAREADKLDCSDDVTVLLSGATAAPF